ncbi:D-glycero-alpha-D-manno-heptose-1,7-bisphosphate 7-phosphatase [Mesorhizobium sp. L-8-3]|uniref:D-glycero-alpha-D-manno-heptose-1,7-bisphosphate 7-phosphatase n=1 Tax=Mesorhizobium sp. L-8-3 TaxID=2744522 RepID=UPI0019266B40|nr:HAD family hydrolase [Mesorhizobium sp. L-8-3]BCH23781.1 haloacid dehalogenase [Mesorhizobium sp. L-8-3]
MADAELHLEDGGLWVQPLAVPAETAGRPALFLDRDGTINVDTGYPRDPAEIVLLSPIVPVIRAANTAHIPVVVVSNQSGIARGLLDWNDFAAVNARLLDLLAEQGCFIAMVLACAYHERGKRPLNVADHPMRKPNPGMLFRAAELLDLDLSGSVVVGDKPSDMEAGRRAGLGEGWLIGGTCSGMPGFACRALLSDPDWAALVERVSRLSVRS